MNWRSKKPIYIGIVGGIFGFFGMGLHAQDLNKKPIIGVEPNASNAATNPASPDNASVTTVAPVVEKRPIVKYEFTSTTNVDRIWHRENRFGIAHHRSETGLKSYGLDIALVTGTAPWVHYEGYRVNASFELQANKQFNFSGGLGASDLTLIQFQQRNYGKLGSAPLWRLRGTYTAIPGTDLRVEGNSDFTYMAWLDRFDQSQIMRVRNIFAEAESTTIKHWDLRTNYNYASFGDGNNQYVFDNLILRDVVSGKVNVQAGVGGGLMGYREQLPYYWNPAHFENYGARLVVNSDFAHNWNIEARFNFGLHKDGQLPREVEAATELHLKFETKSGWLAKLNFNLAEANRFAWWRNDVGINLEMPL